MLIGEKIKRLRKNKNVTQTQLAEALSVSPQSVSKWETHLSAPDISLLPVIARYFGITMDELKEQYDAALEQAVINSVLTGKAMEIIRQAAIVDEK